jgi:signal transduction histidine kinase
MDPETVAVQIENRSRAKSDLELAEREQALRDALEALRRSHEELKATQLKLVQAAKLESIGRLAAGVAHEVKNPLAIILAGAEYLSQVIPSPNPDIEETLSDIQRAVKRATSVIGGLLDFSAATDLTPSIEDLNVIVEQALLLVKHSTTRNHVAVRTELEPSLPHLMLDRTKIEQIFVNVFLNAIDAMPKGGQLTVRTYRKQLTEVGPEVGYRQTDRFQIGQTVVVAEIDDTGTGIDEKDLRKLFDPFFTTKPPGKGTGLGLAVSRTIIALHGASISITNRPEGGARVNLTFRSTRR